MEVVLLALVRRGLTELERVAKKKHGMYPQMKIEDLPKLDLGTIKFSFDQYRTEIDVYKALCLQAADALAESSQAQHLPLTLAERASLIAQLRQAAAS